jgi:DHA1 family bicyclomycin/chloramphenicol resistance-like MFS transporter
VASLAPAAIHTLSGLYWTLFERCDLVGARRVAAGVHPRLCYLENWMENNGSTRQKCLGNKGLILFLAALTAFPALSTDLYLPALPGMTAYFDVPEYQTNLTLILFFVVYAVAILLWGPLSDRYGRRPVLLVGLTCYMLAGVLCAVSSSIFQLMVFRIFQALGTGAAVATATAIIKDVYHGRKREITLAIVQTMTVLSPALAPVVGALILKFTSWRGAFVAQAILGFLVLAGAVAFRETVTMRLTGNPLASLKRLGTVLRNRAFAHLLVNFSLLAMAGLAFITSSSYIYEVTFGLTSQVYSYFFALFAAGMAAGAPIYVWLSRRFERTTIITGCFGVSAASGLLVLLLGRLGPWPLILSLLPLSICISCLRPPGTYLMLAQHEGDAGSVSGLMNASNMVMGSIGMVVVSLELWSRVELIGALALGLALLSLGLWLGLGGPLVRAQARGANGGS